MSRNSGPRRMEAGDAIGFLATAGLGSLCVESAGGQLVASPVRVVAVAGELDLMALDPAVVAAVGVRRAACVVADEFESYEGIRGAIVQGSLGEVGPGGGAVRLAATRAIGFSFAGTLPAKVGGPAQPRDQHG